jgi:hypothetical protein
MATSSASSSEAEEIFHIDHVDPVETVDAADVIAPPRPLDIEPEPVAPAGDQAVRPDVTYQAYVTVWRTDETGSDVEADPSPTTVATEYGAPAGTPARGVIVLSAAATGLCAAIDCGLSGTLTMFFDLCFITICLVGAMSIRRHDLFTAGVLAPLVFAAAVFAVAVGGGDAFVASGSLSKAFFTGLAAHAAALVCGYGVALGVVGGRVATARR